MSGSVVGNLKIRLDFDSSQFERGMAQARRELSTYDRAVGMSTRIAKDNNFALKDSSHALHNMRVAYQGNEQMVKKLTDANIKLKKEGDQTGKYEKNANAIRNYQMKMYDLNKEYEKMQKEMYTANSLFTKSGKAMESVGGVVKTAGEGISQVGAGLTKAGLALTGTMGVFLKQSIDFEQGLAGVQKTTNASNEEMAVLEGNIREMAKTMPIATGELLALGEQAGQLGIAQADIAEFTEVMVMMGTATNLSAEEAGESFARFVNITGHGMDGLDKLGSSVVHLGNNFATTESEIMNLAMGLAGSLSTVGVAEADILGLSAGMSALGINAERGSSSMSKMFIEMAKDVQSGTGNLEKFAEVSGVTVKEFQQAFEKDAMGAMEIFIAGLGEMDDAGGDILTTLEEMGINEIRLRDTILRLAGGHEVLSDAIKTSNEGYEEGNALQEEYDILAQTTASQIEIAKNKFKDMGLTIGGALVPAFIDLMDNSEGLIKSIESGVDWFVNLDDAVKQNIVRFTAFALVGGPLLSMFGNITSGIGGLIIAGGKMNIGIGKLSGSLQTQLARALGDTVTNATATTTSIGELAGGAANAGGAKGMGVLIKSLVGSTGFMWALGLTGVAIAGYAGWKVFGKGIAKSAEHVRKWGEDVSDETDKVLTDFQELSADVEEANTMMSRSAEEGGQKAVESYAGMLASITKTVDERTEEVQGFYDGLSSGAQRVLEESTQKHVDELEQVKKNAEKKYKEINEIYATAVEEDRQLSTEELQRVEKIHAELAEIQAKASGISREQIRETQAALMNDLEEMTAKQLFERQKFLQEDLKAVKENYDEQTKIIDENVAQGIITHRKGEEAKAAERQLYLREVQKVMDEEIKLMENLGLTEEAMILRLSQDYKDYGYTREQVERKVQEVLKSTQDETAELDLMWRRLLIDPVTGEVVTNLPEVMADMYQSDEDWAQLNYMIKEANLDSNMLEKIDEALIMGDVWDELDPEVKELLTSNRVFLHKLSESEEALGRWNELPDEEKLILGNNHDLALKIMNSKELYGKWQELDDDTKKMLGDNEDLIITLLTSEEAVNRFDKIEPETKEILAENQEFLLKVLSSENAWNEFVKLEDERKTAEAETGRFDAPTMDSINTWGNFMKLNKNERKSASANTSSFNTDVGVAGSSWDSFRRKPKTETKTSFFKSVYETIFKSNEKGTNHHPGGLAMVNDERSNRFRELVTLPDGSQFIPEGKNVMLDLPRGSKVLRASLTKRMFPDLPQYADGVGLQTTRVPRAFTERQNATTIDSRGLQHQINQLARLLTQQTQQVQSEGVTINIGTIENHTEDDIPRILEEASWIMQGEGKRLNG